MTTSLDNSNNTPSNVLTVIDVLETYKFKDHFINRELYIFRSLFWKSHDYYFLFDDEGFVAIRVHGSHGHHGIDYIWKTNRIRKNDDEKEISYEEILKRCESLKI